MTDNVRELQQENQKLRDIIMCTINLMIELEEKDYTVLVPTDMVIAALSDSDDLKNINDVNIGNDNRAEYNGIKYLMKKGFELENGKINKFHSAYEGYAMMLEKSEEIKECTNEIDVLINRMWQHIRIGCFTPSSGIMGNLKISAINLGNRAIQLSDIARSMSKEDEMHDY